MTTSENEDGGKKPRMGAPAVMRSAMQQLAELLRCEPESVSALKRTGDGWAADVEVEEIARVPDTSSVMGSYRVELSEDGELMGYERIRRYTKGQIDRQG